MQIGEPVFQNGEHFRRRAFLRGEYRCGAIGAQQRVGYVRGNADSAFPETRIRVQRIQITDGGKSSARQPEHRLLLCVVERVTKRFRHSRAAVDGCASADSDHDFPDFRIQSCADQFSGSECGGLQRVEFLPFQQGHSGGCRHFNDCGFSRDAELRFAETTERIMNGYGTECAAQCMSQRLYGSFAAVGKREFCNGGVRMHGADRPRHDFRRLPGGQGPFELIWCKDNSHAFQALSSTS